MGEHPLRPRTPLRRRPRAPPLLEDTDGLVCARNSVAMNRSSMGCYPKAVIVPSPAVARGPLIAGARGAEPVGQAVVILAGVLAAWGAIRDAEARPDPTRKSGGVAGAATHDEIEVAAYSPGASSARACASSAPSRPSRSSASPASISARSAPSPSSSSCPRPRISCSSDRPVSARRDWPRRRARSPVTKLEMPMHASPAASSELTLAHCPWLHRTR